jgi:hypothetical protein
MPLGGAPLTFDSVRQFHSALHKKSGWVGNFFPSGIAGGNFYRQEMPS